MEYPKIVTLTTLYRRYTQIEFVRIGKVSMVRIESASVISSLHALSSRSEDILTFVNSTDGYCA